MNRNEDGVGARPSETGSHASRHAAVGVDGPSGFDPARKSVCERLPVGFYIASAFTPDEQSRFHISGTVKTRDELDAITAVLTLLGEWLPAPSAQDPVHESAVGNADAPDTSPATTDNHGDER